MKVSKETSKATLIALLSILKDKGVLDDEEIEDIRRHGKIAPYLIARGVISQEDFEERFEEVRKILDVARRILQGHPATPAMMNVIQAHRDRFPGLLGGLVQAVEDKNV